MGVNYVRKELQLQKNRSKIELVINIKQQAIDHSDSYLLMEDDPNEHIDEEQSHYPLSEVRTTKSMHIISNSDPEILRIHRK